MSVEGVEAGPGEPVAVTIDADVGVALATSRGVHLFDDTATGIAEIARLEAGPAPRWVWWTGDTPRALVTAGVRPARCWDIAAVHRLLHGGWRAGPALAWAGAHGLDVSTIPTAQPVDLFTPPDDDAGPVRGDGHLAPSWVDGTWRDDVEHLGRWAELALSVHGLQVDQVAALPGRPAAASTARSESTAEVLCAELEADGLPIDVAEAERVIATFIGPRPTDPAHEHQLMAARDERVLRHLPDGGAGIDLRNPANVKSLLRRAGIEVVDTRAWRLETMREAHPVVDDLLVWRKAERIATTFGYRWLDQHVGADGRLRGSWSGSDGAAGRMTATAGLHNMPADLRPAVVAAAGHVFVRADLGQIEPRVLAAVSGDEALATAALEADMYAPVARRLDVARETAKVAVLGAMYGQTTGHGAAALRGLETAYPTAMRFLADAARDAEGGRDLRTRGGRLVRMGVGSADPDAVAVSDVDARSRAAARGRYGRNAMIQGAAAEFFKTWALVVRSRAAPLGARVVLCLHDELLVQTPAESAAATVEVVEAALQEAAARWLALAPAPTVRFVSDTSIVTRWSDAK